MTGMWVAVWKNKERKKKEKKEKGKGKEISDERRGRYDAEFSFPRRAPFSYE